MQNFTPEDLLLYLYNETSTEKTVQIKAALQTDWSLREKFEVIAAAQQQLEPIKMAPRQQTIDSILQYAEKAVTELTT